MLVSGALVLELGGLEAWRTDIHFVGQGKRFAFDEKQFYPVLISLKDLRDLSLIHTCSRRIRHTYYSCTILP